MNELDNLDLEIDKNDTPYYIEDELTARKDLCLNCTYTCWLHNPYVYCKYLKEDKKQWKKEP